MENAKKNTSKSKRKTKSKILVSGFVFVILISVGFLSGAKKAEAAGACYLGVGGSTGWEKTTITDPNQCDGRKFTPVRNYFWSQDGTKPTQQSPAVITTPQPKPGDPGYLKCTSGDAKTGYMPEGCTDISGITLPGAEAARTPTQGSLLSENIKNCVSIVNGDFDGCIEKLFYYVFYVIPGFFLEKIAYFFNAMVALGLNSTSIGESTFIGPTWSIVRDISNIFFILILIYIAIKIILDLGGHEAKKMIGQVIIMALLINFSMFFTKIIIDSSNMLALVFYNKIEVNMKGPDGKIIERPYVPITNVGEKDIAGGMANAFDATYFMSQSFYDQLKTRGQVVPVGWGGAAQVAGLALIPSGGVTQVAAVVRGAYLLYGSFIGYNDIPITTMLAIIILSGLIMGFAAYAFFIAGMSFLGRLIELWVLIIFSPFAFMSFTIPLLKSTEYIGWDDWLKRLLKVSFMAPIFLFFMYFIFLLINAKILDGLKLIQDPGKQTVPQTIMFIVIPAIMILILLNQATKFAKKSSGALGEALISGVKMATGVAIGATGLGLAAFGRGTLGAFMKGAATGNTAADKIPDNQARILRNEAIKRDSNQSIVARTKAWGEIRRAKSEIRQGNLENKFGIQKARNLVGPLLIEDQTDIQHAAHARHKLDEVTKTIFQDGRVYDQLVATERQQVKDRIDLDILTRNRTVPTTASGAKIEYGNKQKYSELSDGEKAALEAHLGTMRRSDIHHGSVDTMADADKKQGVISSAMQASRTGTYDIRNLANVVAKEQGTGFAKIAMGLTGAMAMGMRGGFKQMGVNYGEAQGKAFKDLGNTLSEALKSVKINIDLSHVGDEKKETGHGGGGGHSGGGHAPAHGAPAAPSGHGTPAHK
ncbi:MAG: hypothetical protein WCP17_02030 [bacterium]